MRTLARTLACALGLAVLTGALALLVLVLPAGQAQAIEAAHITTYGASTSALVPNADPTGAGTTTEENGARRGTTNPTGPTGPQGPGTPAAGDDSVSVDLGGLTDKPSSSVATLLALTFLSLLPAIVLTCTSFTKVLVVLGLTRNALGLQQTPPNQVLAGLALFLSLFIMAPTLSAINEAGIQPYLDGTSSATVAFDDGIVPLRSFMLANADDNEIELLTNVAERDLPQTRDDTPLTTLIPAFILSELKDAFIMGFIIFIPFLIIDIVVSGSLMALGMMMMPPVMVSLPFKLLLFILVNGWALIITALVGSYG